MIHAPARENTNAFTQKATLIGVALFYDLVRAAMIESRLVLNDINQRNVS